MKKFKGLYRVLVLQDDYSENFFYFNDVGSVNDFVFTNSLNATVLRFDFNSLEYSTLLVPCFADFGSFYCDEEVSHE